MIMKNFVQFALDSELSITNNALHLVVKGYASFDDDSSVRIINEEISLDSLPWECRVSDDVLVVAEQIKNTVFASMYIDDALLYEERHEVE